MFFSRTSRVAQTRGRLPAWLVSLVSVSLAWWAPVPASAAAPPAGADALGVRQAPRS